MIKGYDILSVVELLQLIVAGFGFATALREWRFIWLLTRVGHTKADQIVVNHTIFIEVLRCSVHLLVMLCAAISLLLPAPPAEMPGWITAAILLRNAGWFGVSVIAMLGTLSSRQTRLRIVQELGSDARIPRTVMEGVK